MFISYKYLSLFAFISLYACQKGVPVDGSKSSKIKANMEIKGENAADSNQDVKTETNTDTTKEKDSSVSVDTKTTENKTTTSSDKTTTNTTKTTTSTGKNTTDIDVNVKVNVEVVTKYVVKEVSVISDQSCLKTKERNKFISEFRESSESKYNDLSSEASSNRMDVFLAAIPSRMTEDEACAVIDKSIDKVENKEFPMIGDQLKKSGYVLDPYKGFVIGDAQTAKNTIFIDEFMQSLKNPLSKEANISRIRALFDAINSGKITKAEFLDNIEKSITEVEHPDFNKPENERGQPIIGKILVEKGFVILKNKTIKGYHVESGCVNDEKRQKFMSDFIAGKLPNTTGKVNPNPSPLPWIQDRYDTLIDIMKKDLIVESQICKAIDDSIENVYSKNTYPVLFEPARDIGYIVKPVRPGNESDPMRGKVMGCVDTKENAQFVTNFMNSAYNEATPLGDIKRIETLLKAAESKRLGFDHAKLVKVIEESRASVAKLDNEGKPGKPTIGGALVSLGYVVERESGVLMDVITPERAWFFINFMNSVYNTLAYKPASGVVPVGDKHHTVTPASNIIRVKALLKAVEIKRVDSRGKVFDMNRLLTEVADASIANVAKFIRPTIGGILVSLGYLVEAETGVLADLIEPKRAEFFHNFMSSVHNTVTPEANVVRVKALFKAIESKRADSNGKVFDMNGLYKVADMSMANLAPVYTTYAAYVAKKGIKATGDKPRIGGALVSLGYLVEAGKGVLIDLVLPKRAEFLANYKASVYNNLAPEVNAAAVKNAAELVNKDYAKYATDFYRAIDTRLQWINGKLEIQPSLNKSTNFTIFNADGTTKK